MFGLSLVKHPDFRIIWVSQYPDKPSCYSSFVVQMNKQKETTFEWFESFKSAQDEIKNVKEGVLILSIADLSEAPEALRVLTLKQDVILTGYLKVFVIHKIDHPKMNALLKAKGVLEVLEYKISLKALNYKIKNAVNLVEQAKELTRKNEAALASTERYQRENQREVKPKFEPKNELVWLEAWENKNDYWIIQSRNHVRFFMGKWLMTLLGPGPSVGRWRQTDLRLKSEIGWIWEPRETKSQVFFGDEKRWIFFGSCPEFSVESGAWYMVSKTPELTLYSGRTVIHRKAFFMDQGQGFGVCQNSKAAESLKPIILKTIEASVNLETDHIKNASLEGKLGPDAESKTLELKWSDDRSRELHIAIDQFQSKNLALKLVKTEGKTAEREFGIELIMLNEREAIFEVPSGCLKEGEEISFFIQGAKSRVSFSTQVTELQFEESGRAAMRCTLESLEYQKLKSQIDEVQARQIELTGFFRRAKGL